MMHRETDSRVRLQRVHQLPALLMTKENQYKKTKGEHMILNWKEVESSLSKPWRHFNHLHDLYSKVDGRVSGDWCQNRESFRVQGSREIGMWEDERGREKQALKEEKREVQEYVCACVCRVWAAQYSVSNPLCISVSSKTNNVNRSIH